jgi:hypothetical protein
LLFPDFVIGFQKPRATIKKIGIVEEGKDMHEQGVLVDVGGNFGKWVERLVVALGRPANAETLGVQCRASLSIAFMACAVSMYVFAAGWPSNSFPHVCTFRAHSALVEAS